MNVVICFIPKHYPISGICEEHYRALNNYPHREYHKKLNATSPFLGSTVIYLEDEDGHYLEFLTVNKPPVYFNKTDTLSVEVRLIDTNFDSIGFAKEMQKWED